CYIAYRIFVEKRIGLELSLDYKEQITRSLIQDLELEPREVFIAGKTISKDVTLHALREGLPHPGWMGSLPGPRSLAFTPDGQFVLIPEPGGVSQKAVSEEEWRAFYMKRQMGYVKCLAFSPDNRLVVTGDTDLTLWDSRIGSLVSQTEASGQMTDLEFSPSGDKLFAVSNLGDVMVWDRPFRQEPRLIGSHADGRNRSAMGLDVCEPIGQFVSVGHDGTIQIREIESEEPVRTIDAGGEPLNDVVFMKDGARILTVGKSKTVKEWDGVTGTLLRSFEGHTEDVHRICRIPHSLRFATSGGDAKTIVWDYESGEIIGSVDCFPQDPFPLVATPDGLRLMSYGKIWDLKTLSYIAEAPKAAMAISSDGLALAVGGGPYDTRIEPAFPHRFEGIGSSEDSKREVMEEYKRDFWKARYDLPFGAEGFLDLVEESEKKVTGLWNFGSYAKADVGATLEFTGMDLNLEGYSIFGANGEFGIPGIQGEDCLVMSFPIKRSNASYWLSPGADHR
ncbi:MAG: hypothetical protein KC940_26210, partial [Candidatus Omnitrophica bacterium]|nr:hypothetical protein [Candidatus Omnitrophota bacterium]